MSVDQETKRLAALTADAVIAMDERAKRQARQAAETSGERMKACCTAPSASRATGCRRDAIAGPRSRRSTSALARLEARHGELANDSRRHASGCRLPRPSTSRRWQPGTPTDFASATPTSGVTRRAREFSRLTKKGEEGSLVRAYVESGRTLGRRVFPGPTACNCGSAQGGRRERNDGRCLQAGGLRRRSRRGRSPRRRSEGAPEARLARPPRRARHPHRGDRARNPGCGLCARLLQGQPKPGVRLDRNGRRLQAVGLRQEGLLRWRRRRLPDESGLGLLSRRRKRTKRSPGRRAPAGLSSRSRRPRVRPRRPARRRSRRPGRRHGSCRPRRSCARAARGPAGSRPDAAARA